MQGRDFFQVQKIAAFGSSKRKNAFQMQELPKAAIFCFQERRWRVKCLKPSKTSTTTASQIGM